MSRLKNYNNLGTARFVTFSCFRRGNYLANQAPKTILIKQIDLARDKYKFKLLGYVFMPNHVHLVLFPPIGMPMGLVIREIKSKMAREYFRRFIKEVEGRRVFWQKRCYDHNCRTPETVIEKINYCHKNPVIRGLVENMEDWEWSSYNWYIGKRNVPINIDGIEL